MYIYIYVCINLQHVARIKPSNLTTLQFLLVGNMEVDWSCWTLHVLRRVDDMLSPCFQPSTKMQEKLNIKS